MFPAYTMAPSTTTMLLNILQDINPCMVPCHPLFLTLQPRTLQDSERFKTIELKFTL